MIRVTVRLPDELHQRLKLASVRARASLNDVIVATLSDALTCEDMDDADSLMNQVRQMRTILGGLAVHLDPEQCPSQLGSEQALPDRTELLGTLPRLTPPLSKTIASERAERF